MLNEKMCKFEQAEKKLRNELKYAVSEDIDTMDDETLHVIQSVLGFMHASTELILEQTKVIADVERKIDELLRVQGLI